MQASVPSSGHEPRCVPNLQDETEGAVTSGAQMCDTLGDQGNRRTDVAVRRTQTPQCHPHGGAVRRWRVADHASGRHGVADVRCAGLDRAQHRDSAGDRFRADDAVLVDLRIDSGRFEARVRNRPRRIDHFAYRPAHRSLDHGIARARARLFCDRQVHARASTQRARNRQRGRQGRHGIRDEGCRVPQQRRGDHCASRRPR